jgi:hypothetical protein
VIQEYLGGMLKRATLVVLLGFLGLTAGVTFDMFFPSSYEVDDALVLPAHSPHSAADLVSMTRDDHPGVLVVAHGAHHIEFSATGSLGDADRAVTLANRAVILANEGKVKARVYGAAIRQPGGRYALIGLLAGLGAALGFLVPPRWRVTAPA